MRFILAPAKVGIRSQFWLWRTGRRDRAGYSGSLDGTPTHALLNIQALAQAGQHRVNESFLAEAARLMAANAVTHERIAAKEREINESIAKTKALTGRRKDAEETSQLSYRNQLSELRNQLAANVKIFDSLASQAQQALDSWVTFYEVLASQYVRHRMRVRKGVAPAPATIPTFVSIQLTELDGPLKKESKSAS